MCARVYVYLICFVLDIHYQSSGCHLFFQNTSLKLLSVIKRVVLIKYLNAKSMNSALYRRCKPMIVTIEMATNMTAVVDKREMVYEFKSDLTIYDRHTY